MTINFNDVTDTATPTSGTFNTGGNANVRGTGTNLLQRSQALATSPWANFGTVTATNNNAVAPDSTTTATTLALSANSGTFQVITGIGLTTYTFSIYLRAASAVSVNVIINTNLSDFVTTSASVTTSWQRFTISKTTSSGTSSLTGQVSTIGATSATVEAWGAQLEFGSTANTYVSTTTAAIYGTPSLSFSGASTLGLQSDGSLFLQPAGTGALQAQNTTSTTVGGNARGSNAVDWQTSRTAAGQVSSGQYATIGGGYRGTASGFANTISGGETNIASGFISTIGGGSNNTSSASYTTVAGGYLNTNSKDWSFVGGGYANAASGFYNFIGAGFTNSGTANAAVTTQATTTVTNGSTAVTLSASNASIKVGQLITGVGINTFPNTYVAAISGTSLTLSQNATATGTPTLSFFTPHGVVVGGGNNQATGSYSFIGGGGDAGTAANRNKAIGDWSVVGGGRANDASGLFSTICGGLGNANFAGYTTIGGGLSNVTTGFGASVLGGYANSASGTYSQVVSAVFGTSRSIHSSTVVASSSTIASSAGVSQSAILVLARQTTDATATALTSDSNAASTTNQVILPNNSAYYFRGEIVSGVTGGGNTKGFFIEGLIKRGANAASTALVGTPTVTSNYADAGASTWTIAVTADTTNGGLAVTFTGQAGTTIRTVAQIRTTEMTY